MEQIIKKKVQDAAEELNEVLGLEPEIELEQDSGTLKEEVIAGAELVEPDDELSDETIKVVEALQRGGEIVDGDEYEEEDEEEVEEEDLVEDEDEDEEEEVEETVTKVVEKKPEKKPEAKPKPKTKPKPPAAKPTESTRLYAAGVAIKEGKGKGKTIPELIEKADEQYVKSGGTSNLKESGEAVRKAIQALAGFGAVKVQDKGTVE